MEKLIDYAKLFSGHPLNIVPIFAKNIYKEEVWHIISDKIRDEINQDMIKISYLLVYDSYNKYIKSENIDNNTKEVYLLHMDILWSALSDENCAKVELHIKDN